ncbi:serine/threonine protein kinase [Sclerotinia borealis F-4128]|uniref:Serine/threonine protein kinase n=1 Tax=Sclerotinia borealis (strain F-4128) TaxID=1432307 RepID=W9CJD6_SCLBF|nr:serine/threonine protein kinase [Sclerotinia borealis F-4128]
MNEAFRAGHVAMNENPPDYQVKGKRGAQLFEIRSRLATALHRFSVDDKISKGWPTSRRLGILSDFPFPPIRRLFHSLWLCLPSTARVYFYRFLVRFGAWLYGPTGAVLVSRVPFGLYIKRTTRSGLNEPNALKLVEQYTSIPAPRFVDVGNHGNEIYLVMTRVPGQQLRHIYHLMSYTERNRLADDLADYISQLGRIPNTTAYMIGGTLGGPAIDHRMPNSGIGGPFNTEADFNNFLVSHIESTSARILGEENEPRNHRLVFTHSDLHWSNILMDQGRLSGIIDWECAGFKPEYWEFTKAMYAVMWHKDKEELIKRAFGKKYEKELEGERRLWDITPFGC